MKKILLIAIILCMNHVMFSQETEKVKTGATNEIKLNLLMSLFSFPEISYERVWANSIGLGLSAGAYLNNLNNDTGTKYLLLPYGRFYFGETQTKSFFIEVNTAIRGSKEYADSYSYYADYSKTRNTTDIGIGVAFGYKYINSKDFVGELFLGIGRTSDNIGIDVYPRIGISIGKSF